MAVSRAETTLTARLMAKFTPTPNTSALAAMLVMVATTTSTRPETISRSPECTRLRNGFGRLLRGIA